MTFQQLTYVVEISRCGSINKAAHKLLLSQSGISTAVRELEEELGIRFFLRSNRGVECTPEGKEFISYAISLLEQTPLPPAFPFPPSAIPLRRMPFCVFSRAPIPATAFPCGRTAWTPSSRTCLSAGRTWG